jgi:hypothetical protein
MRLCWADKIPLVLFGVITLVLLILGADQGLDSSNYCQWIRATNPEWTSRESYCFVTSAQHWSAFFWIDGFLFLKIVLPVWVIVRLIDLFGGGPALRRADRERQTASSSEHSASIDLEPGEWMSSEPEWRQRLRSRG